MSVLRAVEDSGQETYTESAARRLRGALAERRISGRQLGMHLGKSYAWIQRRLNGEVSMSLEDMEVIEHATGISPLFLIAGVNTENRRPDDPNGGSWLVRPPGLEPGTHCLRVVTDEPQVNEGAVIPFHPRTDVDVTISGDAEVLAFPAAAELEEVDAR